MRVFLMLFLGFNLSLSLNAATRDTMHRLQDLQANLVQVDAKLTRQMNELLWVQRLTELAVVEQVRFTGPPPRGTNGLPGLAGSNEVVISALTFLPRKHSRHIPLIVFAHGEIHGNLVSDEYYQVVRELVEQGYGVIAPDYRGSSGYGADFWKLIDYGGLEVEDVEAARKFALERYPELDPRRVGIIGWSHGGMIAQLAVIAHPENYQACYAGVPVSDLEERVRIRGKDYAKLLALPPQEPGSPEAIQEYRQRSPAWNIKKLKTPLLIQANTNDEDVTWREIQRLINALKASELPFQYSVYTNAPGGHMFNRIDTMLARQSRQEIWRFLAGHLHPEHSLK